MEPINSFKGDYEFLSNFYMSPVIYDGLEYKSVEHAYQAAKTNDPIWKDKIIAAMTAGQAKKLGGKCSMRLDWNDVKLPLMEKLVQKKFQDDELKKKLLATGDRLLVEGNFWGDTFWGVCKGVGTNHLGLILMMVRSALRSKAK